MKNRHLGRGGGSNPDLGHRSDKTAAEEISPCGGDGVARRQITQDLVNEAAAFRRSLDGIAVGKPRPRLTGHGGTITAVGSQNVMKITFRGQVFGKA
jgi:hypothetical protein